ncbi:MAG: helix-turn-helix domain-containing protein [Panacibacter sp.]
MKLYIKNMVSLRCKMLVKEELLHLGVNAVSIELGEVELTSDTSPALHEQIKEALHKWGLELIDNKKTVLIEKIKNIIIESVHYDDDRLPVNFSDNLSKKLNYEYNYLSNLFSEAMGITIEHFIIIHKIERVKELLIYNELNLTEIAWKLHYSSVAHLSAQFKKVTGLTPSHFKVLIHKNRSPLENL